VRRRWIVVVQRRVGRRRLRRCSAWGGGGAHSPPAAGECGGTTFGAGVALGSIITLMTFSETPPFCSLTRSVGPRATGLFCACRLLMIVALRHAGVDQVDNRVHAAAGRSSPVCCSCAPPELLRLARARVEWQYFSDRLFYLPSLSRSQKLGWEGKDDLGSITGITGLADVEGNAVVFRIGTTICET
jgi:hypothetical protein